MSAPRTYDGIPITDPASPYKTWNGFPYTDLSRAQMVADYTALRALPSGTYPHVQVRGSANAVTGINGLFAWDASSTATDDGGTIITPADVGVGAGRWKRIYSGPMNVKWFGALGDGTTNDAAALNAALAAGAGASVLIPQATYHIASALTPASHTTIVGDGPGVSLLHVAAGSNIDVLDLDGKTDIAIGGLGIVKAAGATTTGFGIHVRGASTDILIEHVSADGMARGVAVEGADGSGTAPNAVQVLTLYGSPVSGNTFVLIYQPPVTGDPQTTGNIAYNATGATIQTALEALAGLGVGQVTVSGVAQGPWTVTFAGTLAGTRIDPLKASNTVGTGYRVGTGVTTPGGYTCERVTLRDVVATNSSVFGFDTGDARGVMFDRCVARFASLDGFKIRKRCLNVTLAHCEATYNGQDYYSGANNTGDGLDAYSGGDRLSVIGGIYDWNNGNGITVKSDNLTRDDPSHYGYVRDVQLIGVRACNNVIGNGATFYMFNSDAGAAVAIPGQFTVMGGVFEGNNNDGLWINGRNVTLNGVICRRNKQRGINVDTVAMNVSIIAPIVVGNSQSGAATYDGIRIAGAHVTLLGGQLLGVDADTVTAEADYAALTKYHRNNVRVESTASEVLIQDVWEKYASSTGLLCLMTSGICLIHHRGTGSPISVGSYGSTGSTWVRTDSNGYATQWLKTSGTPTQATTGWQPTAHKKLAAQTVNNTQTTIAHGLGYAVTDVIVTPLGNMTVWQSQAADATNVYLTASAGTTADVYVR